MPLDRATVTAEALALADAEGLAGLTIRRLAAHLGVTPNALYWYFRQKDQLLDALVEHRFAAVVLPEADSREWFVQLRALLAALVDALRPHPAIASLTQTRILLSEPGINIAERALALLRAAGFSAEQAAQLAGFLLSAVVSLVIAEPGSHDVHDEEGRDKQRRAQKAVLLTLPPSVYPNVIDSADALTVCENDDAYYAQGIDLLVAGVRGLSRG